MSGKSKTVSLYLVLASVILIVAVPVWKAYRDWRDAAYPDYTQTIESPDKTTREAMAGFFAISCYISSWSNNKLEIAVTIRHIGGPQDQTADIYTTGRLLDSHGTSYQLVNAPASHSFTGRGFSIGSRLTFIAPPPGWNYVILELDASNVSGRGTIKFKLTNPEIIMKK